MKTHTIVIKWSTSRAADSYGYTLVTLREDGKVQARTCGGGYDMPLNSPFISLLLET